MSDNDYPLYNNISKLKGKELSMYKKIFTQVYL